MGAGRVIAGTTDVAGNLNVDASHTLTANGDIKANSKLSVVGNADFNGNIKVNTLAGTSYGLVYSDPQGNLLKNIPNPNGPCAYPVGPCTPGSLPAFHNGNQMCGNLILGTCTNDDFVLKSNNVNAQFIKPNGSIGFGANFNANPSDPVAFIFSNGPVRARGNSVFGGPMYLFDGPTSPNGDWGIEYTGGTSAPQPGLNFWKPFGSTNGNNNILFLHDNNRIGVGTDNPSSRFTIDSWSDDGLKVMSDPSKKSLEVFNKSTNKTEFVVTSDGVLYAREIYVKLGTIPDYVFESTYKLPTINETQNYVQTHKHLKNMINRNSITEKGANLGEFQRVTLEKLEEAYLYIFQLNERIELLEKELLKSKQ